MKKYMLMLPALLLLLQSCVTEPISCFEPGLPGNDTVDVGYPVLFGNCSFMASEYEWDFGDGSTATGFSPAHAYAAPGEYMITLIAYSKDRKKSATSADNLYVGSRWLFSVEYDSFPAINPLNSMPWDASDDPDLILRLSPADTLPLWLLSTPVISNAYPGADLDSLNTQLTYTAWTWELLDDDGGGAYEIVGAGVFEGSLPYDNKTIVLRDDSVAVRLGYQLR